MNNTEFKEIASRLSKIELAILSLQDKRPVDIIISGFEHIASARARKDAPAARSKSKSR